MRTDSDWMRLAYNVARDSKDPSTQNGAVLLLLDGDYVVGCNNFPKGVKVSDERWVRPGKYLRVEHAERAVIFQAAKEGKSTDGGVLYAVWAACADCARAVIGAGIQTVVTHKFPGYEGNDQWKESIRVAKEMFREAGVNLYYWEGRVGKKILFNGREESR